MAITMQPGGAYRLPRFDENVRLTENVVRVSSVVAARSEFVDLRWVTDTLHAVFRDRKTGEMYAQPVE